MLQLAEELVAANNRQLTPTEHNNVLNYEESRTICQNEYLCKASPS